MSANDNTALTKALAELVDLLQIVADAASGYRTYLLKRGFDEEVAAALSTSLLMDFNAKILSNIS